MDFVPCGILRASARPIVEPTGHEVRSKDCGVLHDPHRTERRAEALGRDARLMEAHTVEENSASIVEIMSLSYLALAG
jgi:hypothetical protein